jgi:hypothetical protein
LRLDELVSLAGLLRLLFFQTMSALSPLFYRKCKIHLSMSWLIEIVEEKTRGKIINGLKKQEKIKSLVLSFRRQF